LKFEIPDKFLEMLAKCGGFYQPTPSKLIDILKWASENREAAGKVAEEVKCLNKRGRRDFEEYMFWLSYKPDKALEKAFEMQEENRKRRSVLSKVIARAKGGGCVLKMPNGLECKITREGKYYAFKFNVGGAEIVIFHSRNFLSETLTSLKTIATFSSGSYGIREIILDGKKYSWRDKTGRAILEAIQKNINPYIYMTIKDE